VRGLPDWACRALAAAAGEGIFWLVLRRRRVARLNLRIAFPGMSEAERTRVARASCRSFVLTGLEGARLLYRYDVEKAREYARKKVEGAEPLLARVRELHEGAGGCVFVTPHLGNWEFLLHAATLAGVPLVIVVRPLDNARLEKYLFGMRASSGQEILSKRDAFFHLRTALRRGRSVGILADQHAGARGMDAPFFGRPASTTTAPAGLAVHFHRPIVLAACLRREGGEGHRALLGEPLWPDREADSLAEIARLTAALNAQMEDFIRQAPEQYLWMHDRWKLLRGR
jgi:KDO2-lipid IV(A) lauroyltransferase